MPSNVREVKDKYYSSSDTRIDFPSLLFRQIDRIAFQLTDGSSGFLRGVEVLEGMLSAHIDKQYEKKMEEIEREFNAVRDTLILGRRQGTEGNISKNAYIKAKLQFKELMRLIKRSGMLPARELEFLDDDA